MNPKYFIAQEILNYRKEKIIGYYAEDKSRGCRVEFEVAKQYDIPHDWIDEYPIP